MRYSDPACTAQDPFVAREAEALRSLGHKVQCIPITFKNIEQIQNIKCDFIMNFCEGTSLDGEPGVEALAAVERTVIPFSGVGSGPYHLSNDKWAMKACLVAAGIPVPRGFVMGHRDINLPNKIPFPLFVKPRFGFGSLQVNSKSCTKSELAMRAAVTRVLSCTGTDAIVEEYIDGRELSVAVIGSSNRIVVMPPIEIEFGKSYRNIPKVRTYDTKNNERSPLYWDFDVKCPASISGDLRLKVEDVARRAYLAIGGDGFGRVDIRLTEDGTPYVLEVNGNCSLEDGPAASDCGIFVLISRALSWSYADTLARLIGAGRLRPLRSYRIPMLSMRRVDGRVTAHATTSIRKGAMVAPVGKLLTAPSNCGRLDVLPDTLGMRLLPEPHIRSLSHSKNPNLVIQRSKSKLWLSTTRSIKPGEELTIDRTVLIDRSLNLEDQHVVRDLAAALRPLGSFKCR